MPQVHFTEQALSDLERIFDFLAQHDPALSEYAADEIVDATAILQRHPLIGRPAQDALRELIISRGRTGYVALYRFLPEKNRVDVLAIRHQRESGFVD
jgi:addiction module RelE/StbE family toxin